VSLASSFWSSAKVQSRAPTSWQASMAVSQVVKPKQPRASGFDSPHTVSDPK